MKKLVILCLLLLLIAPSSANDHRWCGDINAFFENANAPDIPNYEQLINYPSGATEKDENVTVSLASGPVLIDTYISPLGQPDITEISPGLRRYRTFHYVNSASGTTRINFTPFVRYANGSERNLYTVLTDDINDLTVSEYLTSYTNQNPTILSTTDRYGIRVSANTTQPSNIIVHFVYEGSTHYSSVDIGNFVCVDSSEISSSNIVEVQDVPSSPFLAVSALAVIGLLAYRKLYR